MERELPSVEWDDKSLISPLCAIESNSYANYASGIMGTKSLIDQATSVDTILCNFLTLDETSADTFEKDGYKTTWDVAYLSEGSISTIPDNSSNRLRTISLHPERPYHSEQKELESRMVGWYPRTAELPESSSGNDVSAQLRSFSSTYVKLEGDSAGVRFTGLDGSKDIMVSDVRDGSYNDPFDSDNFFQFKHYLSAIKVYAKAEQSEQDLGMWGYIEKVVIMRQPTSCIVKLPLEPGKNGNRIFGKVAEWGTENAKLPIVTTPIFGEKDRSGQNTPVVEYPIELDGHGTDTYLGYSLIKPNEELWLQVHTRAGVYDVKVQPTYNFPEDGSDNAVPIFNPGAIYELHLNFNTNGTLYTFVGIEGAEKYHDLTTGFTFDVEGSQTYQYKWANCYIIKDDLNEYKDSGGKRVDYAGFCFDATVVGNGEGGTMSFGAQQLYPMNVHISPYSADVLWETSPNLISQVELLYGYVRFKVAKKDINHYKEGNAVIAVYDKNGKVLWSWHIWITDTPQVLSYTEGETTISMLDRNLGATAAKWDEGGSSSGEKALETYGLYYQWGRKDPSMGPPTWDYAPINMVTAPYFDYSSTEKDAAEVVRFAAPTLKDAVENPMYLIMPTAQTQTYYFNWLYEKNDFLWGYDASKGSNERKTIYDPCPYGFKVSGGELSDLFSYATRISTTGSYTLEEYGQKVSVPENSASSEGIKVQFYFPYTGFKGVDRGLNSLVSSWRYVGQKADYQSAVVSTYTGDDEYYMHRTRIYLSKATSWNELNVGSYSGHQITDHTNRRTAAPVRCVLNKFHHRVMAFITPDKFTISTGNIVVKFKLFAESFGSQLASATLSVGYHMKNDDGTEGDHQEYVIGSWNISSWDPWSLEDFTFNLSGLKVVGDDGIVNLEETTGTFRFILNVKTVDNINKMSSTTITLARNYIDFESWKQVDSTVYIGQPITREFRLYGESEPEQVLMVPVITTDNGNTYTAGTGIDITNEYRSLSTSTWKIDRVYSTAGLLSFANKGWNYVYIQVKYKSGETVKYSSTADRRWFKVVGMNLTQMTLDDSFDSQEMYVIQHNSNNGYLYDQGAYLAAETACDYNNLFRFVANGSNYRIQNVGSGDYVVYTSRNAALSIAQKAESSATWFGLQCNNNNLFRIYYNNRSWILNNINSNVNTSNSASYVWKIFEVEADGNGILDAHPEPAVIN